MKLDLISHGKNIKGKIRIRKSLDDGSATTLVHAFVTSRIDYCNAVYTGALKTVTNKLQQVLNAAARVVTHEV